MAEPLKTKLEIQSNLGGVQNTKCWPKIPLVMLYELYKAQASGTKEFKLNSADVVDSKTFKRTVSNQDKFSSPNEQLFLLLKLKEIWKYKLDFRTR